MRTLLLAVMIVLILAAAAGFVLKDGQGRPLLLSVLHLSGPPDPEAAVPADGTPQARERPGPKALTQLPGVLQRARGANERVEESTRALEKQMDAADAP